MGGGTTVFKTSSSIGSTKVGNNAGGTIGVNSHMGLGMSKTLIGT
jgi:hypothetical protein